MNSIWRNLYDHFKDRCYGGVFLLAMLVCTGLTVLIWKVLQAVHQRTLVYWLPGVALLAGAYAWTTARRWQRQRPGPWKNEPLSGDELRKARSRLMTSCRTLRKH